MKDPAIITSVAAGVRGARVLERLDELAAIGADPAGGTTRIAFSPEEDAALELVCGWLEEAGLVPAFDSFGNLFASTDGNQPGAATSVSGSHLDTVPNGGPLDGALGVVAAIEAVEAMRATDALPERPVEVVVWRCEEPVRFSQGKVGSLLYSGKLTLEQLAPVGDPPFDVNAALAREERRPLRDPTRSIASLLELHIEQGRRLEQAGRAIGIVTAVAAPIRLRIDVEGRADHSGTTPMRDRSDALCAAAEIALAVESAAKDEAPADSVATTARLIASPGTINVVPGAVEMLVDVRGVDLASMERLVERIGSDGGEIAFRRGVEARVTVLSRGVPTLLRESVVDQLARVARQLGHDPLLLPSGAGHDAQCIADSAAVGMLFAPSVAGVSHSPKEHTRPADVVESARVLAAGWRVLAEG